MTEEYNCFVTNVAYHDRSVYISTTSQHNSIMKFATNDDGKITGPPEFIKGFSKGKIKFIGFIKDKIALIPRNSFNIYLLDQSNKKHDVITIKHSIIDAITSKNNSVCKDEKCYHLIGFVQYYGFNIFVQLSCKHKNDQLLYVIKGNLKGADVDGLDVTNEYNFNRLCLDNGLNENYVRSLHFSGLHYADNKVNLITTDNNRCDLWEMEYFNNISYLAPPKLVSNLKMQARGLYSYNGKKIILSREMNEGINYFTC